MPKYEFEGWWSEEEKADCPEPWERFTIMLFGNAAGDGTWTEEDTEAALKASGYRLVLEKISNA